jgi:acetyl-CoA carboxylase carboxyl transferase subunit alpha
MERLLLANKGFIMSLNFLEFEKPIAELEAKIEALRDVSRHGGDTSVDLDKEISQLEEKSLELKTKIFSDLGAWQVAQLARHPQRPYTLDYLELIFTEFEPLAGDRAYGDDKAIVGGLARLDGRPVMVIGHQKGRETKEKVIRNFGMPKPEGYRKALQHACHYLYRYSGCIPRCWRRRAWPIRGDCDEP